MEAGIGDKPIAGEVTAAMRHPENGRGSVYRAVLGVAWADSLLSTIKRRYQRHIVAALMGRGCGPFGWVLPQ
jgi:hypothetical protein